MADRRHGVRWVGATLTGVAVLGLAGWLASPYVASAALLLDLTHASPRLRAWLPVGAAAVMTSDRSVPTRAGAVPARLYRPDRDGPTLVIVPGVHGGGIDEPRLAALSARVAAAGATVLTVPLPDLRAYRITTRATDTIEDVVAWTAAQRDLAASGRVGLVGISFAGGLALVAAGRPSLSGRLTAVFALGAHADLPRVIRYLCGDARAPQTLAPPHDYGVVLLLRASLDRVVPPQQHEALDRAIVTFLDASSATDTDPERAAQLFAAAREAERTLDEPSRTLLRAVNDREVMTLGRLLAPYADEIGGAAGLSPTRSPVPTVPVFLLHGVDDAVIPASETLALAADLTRRGTPHVETLLTPLLAHADVRPSAGAGDLWRLVSFWTRLWRAMTG